MSRPRLIPSKALAAATSMAVHLVTCVIFVCGMGLLIWNRADILRVLGGVLCLVWAWWIRPRPLQMPQVIRSGVVGRDVFPALYAFADAVADLLGVSEVDDIAIDSRFGASLERYGWQSRRVLRLGLPLWTILGRQEKAALVAQVLAYDGVGPADRDPVIDSAGYSLWQWYRFLWPGDIFASRIRSLHAIGRLKLLQGFWAVLLFPLVILLALLGSIPWLVGRWLRYLVGRDARHAAYAADRLAAGVSGSDALISLLRKEAFRRVLDQEVQDSKRLRYASQGLMERFHERTRGLLWEEMKRELEGFRLDEMQPFAAQRIGQLQHNPVVPSVGLSLASIDWERVDAAFAANEERIERNLVESAPDQGRWN